MNETWRPNESVWLEPTAESGGTKISWLSHTVLPSRSMIRSKYRVAGSGINLHAKQRKNKLRRVMEDAADFYGFDVEQKQPSTFVQRTIDQTKLLREWQKAMVALEHDEAKVMVEKHRQCDMAEQYIEKPEDYVPKLDIQRLQKLPEQTIDQLFSSRDKDENGLDMQLSKLLAQLRVASTKDGRFRLQTPQYSGRSEKVETAHVSETQFRLPEERPPAIR